MNHKHCRERVLFALTAADIAGNLSLIHSVTSASDCGDLRSRSSRVQQLQRHRNHLRYQSVSNRSRMNNLPSSLISCDCPCCYIKDVFIYYT